MYDVQDARQLRKIIKKKKKKLLIEHWQMRSRENNLETEINRCEGCTRGEEQIEESCQQWIRVSNKINAIPETLIRKKNIIKTEIEQLIENKRVEELRRKEQKLVGLTRLEGSKIEIVKKQKLNESIMQEIIEIVKKNIARNRSKYTIYTYGAMNTRTENESTYKNISIR